MRLSKCEAMHLTSVDFQVGRSKSGRPIWRCSRCTATGTWVKRWTWLGRLACECGAEETIEAVLCPDCTERVPAARKAAKA